MRRGALVALSSALLVGTVIAPQARAEDPPPPPPSMFDCTGDATHPINATAAEQADFAQRWTARLTGADPDFVLQDYVDADTLPATIAAEVGFTPATSDTITRGCLTSKLAESLAAADPTFGMDTSKTPPVPFDPKVVKSMLALTVFHNSPFNTPNPDTPPGTAVSLPDTIGAALNALGLNALQNITVPSIAVPTNLGLPTPVSTLIGNLIAAVQGVGLPPLPPLGSLVQLPALPITLPKLPLNLPSLPDVLNTVRSVLDSTTYTVCYKGQKTSGQVVCTTSPLAVPVLIDVQGDSTADLQAWLKPTVNAQYPTGVSMMFSVQRLNLSNPLQPPPPVNADVTVAWDIPLANARAHLGFLSTYKPGISLPKKSDFTATVTNLNEASQGNPTIAFKVAHDTPDTDVQVQAGVSRLVRNASTGATSAPETTLATLGYNPVPLTTTGTFELKSTNAGPNKTRYHLNMSTSAPSVLDLGILREYVATEVGAPCCPVQSIKARIDKLPTYLDLDVTKDAALNQWDANYGSNTVVDKLTLNGGDFPTHEDYNKPESTQTSSSFTAEMTKIPTCVHVTATLPEQGANPRAVDLVFNAFHTSSPNTIVTIPTVDVGTIDRVKGDVQRSLKAHAEDVPGRIHVNAKLAGDALNTPAGDNLDVDLTYDSSGTAKNLSVDFFDKGDKSTSKLSGTLATLPPYFHAVVGSHPGNKSVTFDSRTAATDAPGSAALGTIFLKYAKNAEFLNLGATTPTTTQYAVVKSTNGADATADTADDTIAIETKYTGLKRTAVSLVDDGLDDGAMDLHAKVVNDADRTMTVRFDSPKSALDAVVDAVPKDIDVTYQRRRTGGVDPECGSPDTSHKVIYDAVSPIKSASVRIQDKLANGSLDPNSVVVVSAGDDPLTAAPDPIPTHMELFSNGTTKAVTYRANGSVGKVAASILDANPACGSKKGVNVDLRGVPTQFGAVIDPDKLRFSDLASTTTPIEQVALAENNPVTTPVRSAAIAFTDNPGGTVPNLPTSSQVSVTSDKRPGGGTSASVFLPGIRRFAMTLRHENPADADSAVAGVSADLQVAAAVNDVGTNLDFLSDDGTESRVRGKINSLPPNMHLDLDLQEGDTRLQYQTPGGHLDLNLEIGLGTIGQIDSVVMPGTLPIGVTLRDSLTCTCAKKVGLFMLGAPSALDIRIDRIKEDFRGTNEVPFLHFEDYAPPAGNTDLSVDVLTANDADATKNLKLKAVMHGVQSGYGIDVLPIATGAENSDDVYFDLLVKGTKAITNGVDLDVATGVPDVPSGPAPCSACKLKLTGKISNLPPGFHFNLGSAKSGSPEAKHTNILMEQLGPNGLQDNSQSIADVALNVLLWQFEPNTTTVRTTPQVQADIRQIPAKINIEINDGAPKEGSFAQPCAPQKNTLPGINYTAEGNNPDSLDLDAKIDFVMLSDDPTHPDLDAAVLKAAVTDLSHSLHFENTPDGKFKVTAADPKTTELRIEVSAQTLAILNWSLEPEDCGFSTDFGPINISSHGGLRFSLRTGLVLDISGLKDITLDPGLIVNVDGTFDKVTFGLNDPDPGDGFDLPAIVDGLLGPPSIRLTAKISDSIRPSFDLSIGALPTINFTIEDLRIDMVDLTSNQTANWIDLNLLVPCDVDVSWDDVDITSFHAFVDTSPGLFAEFTNGFETTDSAKFLIVPAGTHLFDGLRFLINPIYSIIANGGFSGFSAGIRCPS